MPWLCVYCGKVKPENEGYPPVCCGEVHGIEVSSEAEADEQWAKLEAEMREYVKNPAKFFNKEK